LGSSAQGHWRLRIDRPLRTIYVVTLRDTASAALLAETALYREDTDR
jgi:hypothetical protein